MQIPVCGDTLSGPLQVGVCPENWLAEGFVLPEKFSSKDLAILSARIADGKQAEDILVLGIRELLFLTDYFVIAHGHNRAQIQAIADEIHRQFKKRKVPQLSLEGYEGAHWILMDYGGVVIHLFDLETRNFYGLEMLWGDAPRVPWRTGAGENL